MGRWRKDASRMRKCQAKESEKQKKICPLKHDQLNVKSRSREASAVRQARLSQIRDKMLSRLSQESPAAKLILPQLYSWTFQQREWVKHQLGHRLRLFVIDWTISQMDTSSTAFIWFTNVWMMSFLMNEINDWRQHGNAVGNQDKTKQRNKKHKAWKL